MEGIRCETVLVTDNMATSQVRAERSGLAGCDIVVQAAAAAALEGMDLDGVKRIAAKANANLSSLSATMELGENPVTEKSMGWIGEDEVHIGIGVTGEPAMKIIPMGTAKQIGGVLTDHLAEDLRLGQDDEVAVSVNGGGTVTVMEALIMCREVLTNLSQRGVRAFDVNLAERIKVGKTNAVTVSILKLDPELRKYVACPARSPLVFKHHF
jgi:dihydroxyacetone kinase-like protein